jgi:hypothetical protein
MHQLYAALFALSIALFWPATANASGDFTCSPSWRLSHSELTDCDNMAVLQPGNDTRVNLGLLLLDLRVAKSGPRYPTTADALFDWPGFVDRFDPPAKPSEDDSYAEGEGSRCRTNASGGASFTAAVEKAKLTAAERTALTAARDGLRPDCVKATSDQAALASLLERMKTPRAKAFARYLIGAAAFYDADYDAAASQFAALRGAHQPWIKETARYMLGRVEVNRAQLDAFDECGTLRADRKIDPKVTAAAEAALHSYLRDYPSGAYAVSARGLLRRVYWLGGEMGKLAAEYATLFGQDPTKRGIGDAALLQEIDNKLLPGLSPSQTSDRILLAVLDLQMMRHGEETAKPKPFPLSALEAQRKAFTSNPALFDFLLAAHALFEMNNPAKVLRLIPDAARQPSFGYLQFSRQALRGMALDVLGDRNARGYWTDMLAGARLPYQRPAIELALAMHDERNNALGRVFDKGSPVRTPAIREILLMNVAPAALLRRQAGDKTLPSHERELALFTLLYKGATRGPWRDFLTDTALVPAGAPAEGSAYDLTQGGRPYLAVFTSNSKTPEYDCPELKTVAGQLVRDPASPKARLCLADFVRIKGFDDFFLDHQPPKSDLGGTASLFPGQPYSRLEVYKAIIADPKVGAPDKAYALYRAVNCYGPSGYNGCGGRDVPIAQRKAWFTRLKKEYATSSWAKDLRYYW